MAEKILKTGLSTYSIKNGMFIHHEALILNDLEIPLDAIKGVVVEPIGVIECKVRFLGIGEDLYTVEENQIWAHKLQQFVEENLPKNEIEVR